MHRRPAEDRFPRPGVTLSHIAIEVGGLKADMGMIEERVRQDRLPGAE